MNKHLLIAGAVLAASYITVVAQDECQHHSIVQDSESGTKCGGQSQTQTTTMKREYNTSAQTWCKPNGWRKGTEDKDVLTLNATGQCGSGSNSGNGEWGHCAPIPGTPTTTLNGATFTDTVTWTNQLWVAQGNQCQNNGEGFDSQNVSAEACDSGLCCDSTAAEECNHSGEFNYYTCECVFSPILVDTKGNGFDLTDPSRGVAFDLNADGVLDNIAWTKRDSDDAFLVLDRNGNGVIDDGSELFGSATAQDSIAHPNGFNALARFDENRDGQITSDDSIFGRLALWIDANHSGRTESGELRPLAAYGLKAVSLKYHESRAVDVNGNAFRYWSRIEAAHPSTAAKKAVDVFLKSQ